MEQDHLQLLARVCPEPVLCPLLLALHGHATPVATHIAEHLDKADGKYVCPFPHRKDKSFRTLHKHNMIVHLRSAHTEEYTDCPVPGCDYQAKDPAAISKHNRKTHKSSIPHPPPVVRRRRRQPFSSQAITRPLPAGPSFAHPPTPHKEVGLLVETFGVLPFSQMTGSRWRQGGAELPVATSLQSEREGQTASPLQSEQEERATSPAVYEAPYNPWASFPEEPYNPWASLPEHVLGADIFPEEVYPFSAPTYGNFDFGFFDGPLL